MDNPNTMSSNISPSSPRSETTMEDPIWLVQLIGGTLTFRVNFNVEEFTDFVPTTDRYIVESCIRLGVWRNMFFFVLPPPENQEMQNDGQVSPVCEDVVDNGQLHEEVVEEFMDFVPRMGKPMLQVFSVRIMNTHPQYRGRLYGEIKVTRGMRSQHIYNLNRENAESISPGDFVLLIGPTQSITAFDSFCIDVALVYEYNNWLLDDEVISRQITWNSCNRRKEYDTLFKEEVKGLFGWVKLCYVVFLDAVAATLEVTLINGEEENPTKLYGKLTARNGDFLDESAAKSELFYKTLAENIVVSRGRLIPLLRSLVAVSLDSYLIVEAELWDSVNGNEIAKGIAEFPAQPSGTGTSEKTISGEYGEIKVKVTWAHSSTGHWTLTL